MNTPSHFPSDISPGEAIEAAVAELPLGPEVRKPERRPVLVHLPRIWTTSFALRINWLTKNFDRNGVELPIDPPPPFTLRDSEDEKRSYEVSIGGMDGERSKDFVADRHVTIRDARLIAALLTFRGNFSEKYELPRLSLRSLCRMHKTGKEVKDNAGGKRIGELRDDVEHLEHFWVRTHRPWAQDDAHVVAEKLVSFKKMTKYEKDQPHTRENIDAEWIEKFTMNAMFLRVLNEDGRAIRLDVLNSFQSEMLQLWYLVIPALASHPRISKQNPWNRDLRDLFHVAGVSFKTWRAKDFRHERGGKLAFEQLNGAETMNGKVRVDLALNQAGDDWKLLAWIERPPKRSVNYNPDGFFFTYWIAAGKSTEEFEERLRRGMSSFNAHEIELLTAAKYPYLRKGDAYFLKQAKALLGEHRFAFALSQAKASIASYIMGGGCNPGSVVGTALKDAYKQMLERATE